MEDLDMINHILSQANIGIWTIELDDNCKPRMFANQEMQELLGITTELTPEETYEVWYNNIHPDYYDTVSIGVDKMIAGKRAEISYPWLHPTDGTMYVRCGGVRDITYTKGIRLSGCHQNITDLKQFQKDPLTGLYTKEFFFEKAKEIIDENPNNEYRILVSDIENFKIINEKYGIEVGDSVLKYLAQRCKKYIPNYIIGARIYADKFVFLQHGISQTREEGLEIENNILKDAPVNNISWKHGIYYTTFDRSVSIQTMYDRARLAMESIKGSYDVKCAVYNEQFRTSLMNDQQILDNMEKALMNEEFQVYLQPKHDLQADKTGGAEALVRWYNPDFGFMNPGLFIPLFEKNGFVKKLDMYVLKHVCIMLRRWMDHDKPCVPISVKLSRRDFESNSLTDTILRIVNSYSIPHNLIHFELTESAFSEYPERISAAINILHSTGFIIELDDFGTGYSSLITLSDLDFDMLKLDMSIIKNDKPGSERNVLDFCTQLVKMMKLKSVAEGVETVEQLERLKSLGCDYIQGYYYSKPLPVNEFEEYLNIHSA